MIFIIFFQLVMIFIMVAIKHNSFDTKIFALFSILWMALLTLVHIAPLGDYHMSFDTMILCWLFIIFFDVGYVFGSTKSRKREFVLSEESIVEQYRGLFLNSVKFKFFLILLAVALLIYAFRYQQAIVIGDYLDARNARYYVGSVFGSTMELLFYNYIISACGFLVTFIIAFSIVFGQIKNKVFWISLINYVLFSFIGAGRFTLVILIIYILFLALLKNHYFRGRLTFKKIRITIMIGVAGFAVIFGMTYLTAIRRGVTLYSKELVGETFDILWDQIVGYNTGPFSALSYMYDSGRMYNHFYIGKAVLLNGFDELLSHLFGFVGIPYECSKFTLGEIANARIHFGNASFNALYTCIYWFFSDFGYTGVIIFSAIFGIIERKSINKFDRNPDIFSLMLMIHILYFLFVAHMIWQINNVDSLVYIAVIIVIKNKVVKKNAKA